MKWALVATLGVAAALAMNAARAEAAVIFQISGEVTSAKTLFVYGYAGNGVIDAEDFGATDYFIGSADLVPEDFRASSGSLVPPTIIQFDITAFLASLPAGTEWIGFNLSESESSGSVVTIEYLVLGTFLSLALITGVAETNSMGVPMGPIMTDPLPNDINNPPGPNETRGVVEFRMGSGVPEPGAALLWLVGGGCAALARLRRRRNAAH